MDATIIALAAGAGTAVLLLVMAVARLVLSQDILVQSRLAALDREATRLPPAAASTSIFRGRSAGLLGLVDRGLRRFLGTAPRQQLDRAGIGMSLGDFFMVRAALVAGCSIVALFTALSSGSETGGGAMPLPMAAGAGAALGLLLPAVYLRVRIARRARQTERQLVELCEVMSTMLSSGFGYMQALGAAAEQIGRPLGEEVGRFLDAVRLGSDFDRALAEARTRINSPDFEVVATALEVQRRTGGNLSEILKGVGQTIRERQAFQQELHALTSRERFSAIIVAVFPLLLAGLLMAMMPEVFGRLITEPTGRLVLGVALCMDLLGYALARRLAKLEM
ncbi:MAG: type II secretion system F family protein [Dehalococcoidia bacterium]|nr:type II secretion system F family protein [Dehalococcoidia bacterium]